MPPTGFQLRRIKGWRMPPGGRSVARPTRWGNLYPVGAVGLGYSGPVHGRRVGEYDPRRSFLADSPVPGGLTAGQAVALYRADLESVLDAARDAEGREHPVDRALAHDLVVDLVTDLHGRDLGCWCQLGAPCHRDVLLDLANSPLVIALALHRGTPGP